MEGGGEDAGAGTSGDLGAGGSGGMAQGECNLRDGVLLGLKEIKEGILKVDHGLGVIIDILEGTEGEKFGGWLVKFLGNVMLVARDAAVKAGQVAGQAQEEVEQGSSSGSSSSSSSSSSEDEGDEGSQGKVDEGEMIMGSWKVINVY